MNQRRLTILLEQQTTTARKVFEAVPVKEAWAAHQISSEMKREGCNYSLKVVEGCLSSLAEDGLIKEKPRGSFQRVVIEEPAPVMGVDLAADGADAMAYALVKRKQPDLLTLLGDIANKLRGLADDIDTAALMSQEEMQKLGHEGRQLQQLREMLKGVIG